MTSVPVTGRIQPEDKTLTDAEIEGVAAAIVAPAAFLTCATLRA
jgi:hypothetical protein